jgi:hypothetical protein
MAILIVTALDVGGDPLAGVPVHATLTDLYGQVLHEFTSDGFLVREVMGNTGADGIAQLDLIPNASVLRDNTYYSVKVGNKEPVLIQKSSGTETLLAARAISPSALGAAVIFDNLADVDLEDLNSGDTIRYQGGRWVSWPFPTGGGGGGGSLLWTTIAATQTLVEADSVFRIKANAAGGAMTLTLPSAVGNPGMEFTIKRVNTGVNAVTIAPASGQTIDGAPTYSLNTQWETLAVSSDNVNWMVI